MNAPTKTWRPRRRWVRRGVVALAIVLALPFAALHILSFAFGMHENGMKSFSSGTTNDGLGHSLRFYELEQPDAQWNIIFIHGTPASGADFAAQFRDPFPRANLFSYDRPGFGHSGRGLRHPTLDDQADIVGALLPKAGGRRTILVGHSYGGPIALLAALKFTNQVAGVLMIGGCVDPGEEHVLTIQWIGNWPVISWLIPRALRQCNRELIPLRGQLEALKKLLPSLSVPVMMLHGGKDPLVPVDNVAWLRARLTEAGKSNLFSATVIPEYNHFIPWEHPDAVQAALHALADRIEGLQATNGSKMQQTTPPVRVQN